MRASFNGNSPTLRRSVPFLPDESFTHQPCATFQSWQEGGRIIGRLHYELVEEPREKFLSDPTYFCEPCVLFGQRDDIREVRVGNVDWGGGDVHLLPGQSVAVSYGDLFLGVVPLPLDRSGQPASGHILLAYGDDQELRLPLRIFGGPELHPEDEPLQVLLFVEVKVPNPEDTLDRYAGDLSGWQLSQKGAGTSISFSAAYVDGTKLAYPPSETDPDPIGDALHLSPGFTLRPGDLIKLINGETPLSFLEGI